MNTRSGSSSDAWSQQSDSQRRSYAAVAVVVIVIACLILGATVISLPVLRDHGFPLDDSWIHQIIGRNTARFGVPGYVPGVATAGSSSAIWPWIIAFNYRFMPFLDPTVYLLLFNIPCVAVIAFVLYSAATRDALRPLEVVALAALPTITGNFAWLISTGMEHLLFIATAFLAAHFWLAGNSEARWSRPLLAGLFCALSIATRQEAGVFLPIFLVVGWWLGKSRREFTLFLIPCAIFILLVVLNNLWTSHSVMPVTFSGRRWLYLGDAHAGDIKPILALLRAWGYQIVKFFLFTEFAKGSIGTRLVLILACAALALGLIRLFRRRAWQTLFLILLAVSNYLIYCIMLPTTGHAMRYQAMTLVFIFPLMALGCMELVYRVSARVGRLAPIAGACDAGVVVLVFAVALYSLFNWMQITDAGIQHINGTHVRMGKWLAANVPAGTPVAVFDIGGIGYFSNVKIIDLGGLTDPSLVTYLYSGTWAEYLKDHHISLVVLPTMLGHEGAEAGSSNCDDQPMRLKLCNGPTLHKDIVVRFATDPEVWDRAFIATGHAAPSQVLYRIEGN